MATHIAPIFTHGADVIRSNRPLLVWLLSCDHLSYVFSLLLSGSGDTTLKLGKLVRPITVNTNPIKTKKKDEARKLAEMGCCMPIF